MMKRVSRTGMGCGGVDGRSSSEMCAVTRLSWEFGPGTRSPRDSMAVSSRRLRRRALRLRPVRVMVFPVIWAPTVVRKGPRAAPAGRELSVIRRADSWRMVSRAICCLAASAWVAH